VVVGLIDVPKLSRTYFAVKGKGAFVRERSLGQDRKIHVSGKADLKQALLSTGFSSYDEPALEKQLQIFSQLLRETRGIRRAGSAAYDLCMVAEGVFDAYWEKNLSSWDTAAGSLLVREAGGKVTNYCGDDFSVDMNSILASNGSLHAQLTSVLSSAN
ncbi:MAG: inositol monophosphatase, partial [Bdellovibrionales bacterium]|nr:inositol monophosphatase [Bdellovibrionales bacterium]